MSTSSTPNLNGLPPSILEDLKKAAERSRQRQLKRLQQLQKQAEYAKQRTLAWQEKERQVQERDRGRREELEIEALRQEERRTAAETRRIENQKEEEKQRQDHLNFLQCKLDSAQQRSEWMEEQRKTTLCFEKAISAKRQEQRDVVKQQKEVLKEEKRREIAERIQAFEERWAQRNEAIQCERRLQSCVKRLVDLERQQDILYQAALHEAQKRQHLAEKQFQKGRLLKRLQRVKNMKTNRAQNGSKEKEAVAFAKAEKAEFDQHRVQSRLEEKRIEEEKQRKRQNCVLEEKMLRAIRIEQQREMVRDALSSARREMALQEEAFKKSLERSKTLLLNSWIPNSPLLSSLYTASRPRTASGRLEGKSKIPKTPSCAKSYTDLFLTAEEERYIHQRARELKDEIDRNLMEEMALQNDEDR